MFKVAESEEQKKPAVNVPRSLPTSSPDLSSPPYRSDQKEVRDKDIVHPVDDVRSFHSGLDQITKERYDRDQNNVKQEASTMSRTSRTVYSSSTVIICALLILLRTITLQD